jgi:hypothetical protein
MQAPQEETKKSKKIVPTGQINTDNDFEIRALTWTEKKVKTLEKNAEFALVGWLPSSKKNKAGKLLRNAAKAKLSQAAKYWTLDEDNKKYDETTIFISYVDTDSYLKYLSKYYTKPDDYENTKIAMFIAGPRKHVIRNLQLKGYFPAKANPKDLTSWLNAVSYYKDNFAKKSETYDYKTIVSREPKISERGDRLTAKEVQNLTTLASGIGSHAIEVLDVNKVPIAVYPSAPKKHVDNYFTKFITEKFIDNNIPIEKKSINISELHSNRNIKLREVSDSRKKVYSSLDFDLEYELESVTVIIPRGHIVCSDKMSASFFIEEIKAVNLGSMFGTYKYSQNLDTVYKTFVNTLASKCKPQSDIKEKLVNEIKNRDVAGKIIKA